MHLQTLAYEMNRIRSHPLKGKLLAADPILTFSCAHAGTSEMTAPACYR